MTRLTKIRMIRAVIPMIKKILTGVAIAMLVVGIGLVAFPPISNFIGTQISNGEADGFDTRVEEVEDGSFDRRSRTERLTKMVTKLTGTASVPPNSPLFSRLTSADFSVTALPITKNLKRTSMKCSATIPIHRLPSILMITA